MSSQPYYDESGDPRRKETSSSRRIHNWPTKQSLFSIFAKGSYYISMPVTWKPTAIIIDNSATDRVANRGILNALMSKPIA